MKRFLTIIVFVVSSIIVFAQAPKGINYQGVARNGTGDPIATKDISVKVSILKKSASGELEYTETHKVQTNQFGLFTLVIGKGTVEAGSFSAISWAAGEKWLKVEMDINGGSNYTLAGTQELMSVPYAFYAESSGSGGLTGGTGISIANGIITNLGDNDSDPTNELQDLSSVLTKGNNAGGLKITNLGNPTANSDAATKSYVDTQNALDTDGSPTNEIQDLTLNTTTNILKITNNPSATNIDLSPYKQTLSQVLSNGATGNSAGNKTITNLSTPVNNNDATTKSYVDNAIARNFAFKVKFDFTNSTGGQILSQTVPLSSTKDFDSFNVISGNTFTVQDAGIYVFTVEGSYQYGSPSAPALYLIVNGVQSPVAIVSPVGGGDPKYNSTFMFNLNTGQTATLLMEFVPNTARFIGSLFGYKL